MLLQWLEKDRVAASVTVLTNVLRGALRGIGSAAASLGLEVGSGVCRCGTRGCQSLYRG